MSSRPSRPQHIPHRIGGFADFSPEALVELDIFLTANQDLDVSAYEVHDYSEHEGVPLERSRAFLECPDCYPRISHHPDCTCLFLSLKTGKWIRKDF